MSVGLRETVVDPKTGKSRTGNVFENELVVKTTGVSGVMESRAVLEGEVTRFSSDAFNENELDLFFYYAEQGNPVEKNEVDAGALSSTGRFTIPVEGLIGQTNYQFQAGARIDNEKRTGSVKQLTTGLLEVETYGATNVTRNVARLNGSLSKISGVDAENVTALIGFRKAGAGNFTTVSAGSVSNSGDTFFVDATSLDSGTDYEFKAKIEALGDVEEGELKTVKTAFSEDVGVNTISPMNVEAESAKLSGEITRLRAISSVDYHFEWGLQGNMSNSTSVKTVSSTGNVSEVVSGLDADTVYECELIAEGQENTYSGGTVSFTTDPIGVSTDSATQIQSGSAALNGTLDALEVSSADVKFEHRIAGTAATFTTVDAGTASSAGSFSALISPGTLSENTQFEFRAIAEANGSTFEGSLQTFTTLDQTVRVDTSPAEQVQATEAELNGNITTFDNVESGERFFEYGTSSPAEIETPKEAVQNEGMYSSIADGLDSGETYQFRPAVETFQGKTVGSAIEFTTKALSVTSGGATATAGSAELNGTLEALTSGGDADVRFEWGEQGNNFQESTTSENLSSTSSFTGDIDNLDPGTTYEFKAVGTENSSGETDEGQVLAFSTDNLEVSTSGTLEINTGSIEFEGSLDENESGNSVGVSFEYQKASESGFNGSVSAGSQSSLGSFSTEAAGLEKDTQYEFRAVATQDGGTVRGSSQTATTKNIETGNETVTSTSASSFDVEFEITIFTGNQDIVAGIDYVKSSDGDFANSTRVEDSDNPHSSEKILDVTADGLSSSTDYDWRSFVEVDGIRVEGPVQTATTA